MNTALPQDQGMILRKREIPVKRNNERAIRTILTIEEAANTRSNNPKMIREDGAIETGKSMSYLSANSTTMRTEEVAFRSIIPTSLLLRYADKGAEMINVNYIVTPDGNAAEVSFWIVGNKQLDVEIPNEELVYWRAVSDELKRVMRFKIEEYKLGLQYYTSSATVPFFMLLDPERTHIKPYEIKPTPPEYFEKSLLKTLRIHNHPWGTGDGN